MHIIRELRDEKLDFWIKNNLNVLFIGHYGSGKTTRILDAFKRNNLRFKYFSAATMDPWCDFIGVPKVVSDEKGPYLDYILPRDMRDDTIDAIYMDEFNRSHKKVRNAVMELLQFKTINGRPFKNLKIIWAAINPEDEGEYQVEALDKAQKDRFHVRIGVPYEPCFEFFKDKYDSKKARAAIEWWKALREEHQMEVSPRRLEYALDMFNLEGGNIKDVLPPETNPSKLAQALKNGPVEDRLKELFTQKSPANAKQFLSVENNYAAAVNYLCDELPNDVDAKDWRLFFLTAIPTEKLMAMFASNEEAYKLIMANCDTVPIFRRAINDILNTKTDKVLARRIRKEMEDNPAFAALGQGSQAEKPYFSKRGSSVPWTAQLTKWMAEPMNTTPQRKLIFDNIRDSLPPLLSQNEAVDTLEILNLIASRSHASTLKDYGNFVGMVNHCIDQIHKATNLGWREIMTNWGQKFRQLTEKLRDAGMDNKLYRPAKKVPQPTP